MMETDDLDCAKCQKSRRRDMIGIYGIVNDNKTKDEQCSSSSKRPKMASGWTGRDAVAGFLRFLERESIFSLDFLPIGPLVLDGARSKVVLRGEGYMWTLIWWSSDNSKR